MSVFLQMRRNKDQQQKQQQLLQEQFNQDPNNAHKLDSPSRTMLGKALSHKNPENHQNHPKKYRKKKDKLTPLPPMNIMEVPFRRQDRRVLNSRKRRVLDRKLIKCIVTAGLFVMLVGGALLGVWWVYQKDVTYVGPFVLIGPVLLLFGLMLILFSIEICQRLRINVRRVKDKSVDTVINLHEVKHWVQPETIPYGWGHDDDEQYHDYEDAYDRRTNNNSNITRQEDTNRGSFNYFSNNNDRMDRAVFDNSRGGTRILSAKSSRNFSASLRNNLTSSGSINSVHPVDEMDMVEEEKPEEKEEEVVMVMSSRVKPIELSDSMTDEDEIEEQIPSDLFDQSLRFSNVDRPVFMIDRSSPTKHAQRRGSFVDEDEKILKLLATKAETAV